VYRRAHHGRADDLTLLKQRQQRFALESLDASPQTDERRPWLLRLQARQPFDRASNRQALSCQQQLPRQ
jgi:hypothetical protein